MKPEFLPKSDSNNVKVFSYLTRPTFTPQTTEALAFHYASQIHDQLVNFGFPDDEDLLFDLDMVYNAIDSAMKRQLSIHHPVQDIVDNNVDNVLEAQINPTPPDNIIQFPRKKD